MFFWQSRSLRKGKQRARPENLVSSLPGFPSLVEVDSAVADDRDSDVVGVTDGFTDLTKLATRLKREKAKILEKTARVRQSLETVRVGGFLKMLTPHPRLRPLRMSFPSLGR